MYFCRELLRQRGVRDIDLTVMIDVRAQAGCCVRRRCHLSCDVLHFCRVSNIDDIIRVDVAQKRGMECPQRG